MAIFENNFRDFYYLLRSAEMGSSNFNLYPFNGGINNKICTLRLIGYPNYCGNTQNLQIVLKIWLLFGPVPKLKKWYYLYSSELFEYWDSLCTLLLI